MTDYYPHHSTYDHHQHAHSGHTISYAGDPTEENAVRRSATHGSHNSHSQSHASASTRSWVHSNQVNPPPPPVETAPLPGQTPFHGPRPLPDPHMHQQLHYMNPAHRPFQYDAVEEEEEDGDYMPSEGHNLGGFHFGYPREAGGVTFIPAGPSELTSAPSSPVPAQHAPSRNRSFVGGFFKGLKRIPRMFRGGGEKRRLVRRGTFGTEETVTPAFTGNNTLPRYLSNPSIGPTNPQFAHRLSQAVANGTLPPDVTPSAFQIRPPLVSPQQPVVLMVTPPSDGAEEEQQAEYFDGPPAREHPEETAEMSEHHIADPMERTTVMMYGRDSRATTVMQTQPTSTAPIPVPRSSSSVPRVSYPVDLPTRSNSAQIQAEAFPLNPGATRGGPTMTPLGSPPRQPHRRTTPQSFSRAPKDVLSPPTSAYTVTTATSYYDPSFASDLGPIEKFFKGLYNLPWISQGRVTIDYRPGDSPRAKGKIKSLKKPLTSWYHSVLSRSRRNSLDLLSSNTSGRTSNVLSSLASPLSRRSRRSSGHRHHSSKSRHHRSRRRHTTSTTTAGADTMTQRSASPILPSVYPYTIPPYPPYTFPYVPYPTPGMSGIPTPVTPFAPPPTPARSPRGPRAARSHRRKGSSAAVRYPHGGYAPFQPLAMPPPPQLPTMAAPGTAGGVYFVAPSSPRSQDGDTGAGQSGAAAPVQLSPVFVQYIPAAFRPADNVASANVPVLVSPPTTPQKPTAVASSSHHHS